MSLRTKITGACSGGSGAACVDGGGVLSLPGGAIGSPPLSHQFVSGELLGGKRGGCVSREARFPEGGRGGEPPAFVGAFFSTLRRLSVSPKTAGSSATRAVRAGRGVGVDGPPPLPWSRGAGRTKSASWTHWLRLLQQPIPLFLRVAQAFLRRSVSDRRRPRWRKNK